jgi:hypothetical protein
MAAAQSFSGGLCGSPLGGERQLGPGKARGSEDPAPPRAPRLLPGAPPAAGAGEAAGERRLAWLTRAAWGSGGRSNSSWRSSLHGREKRGREI